MSEDEPRCDWKIGVYPGLPDVPQPSMSRTVAGIEQIATLEAENQRLAAYADGETDKLRDALRRLDEQQDELERLRGAVPPPGWIITKQSELDRLHNESEARLIERDNARAEVERLERLWGALAMVPRWTIYICADCGEHQHDHNRDECWKCGSGRRLCLGWAVITFPSVVEDKPKP